MSEFPTVSMPPPEELGPPIPPERVERLRHLRRVALLSALVAVVIMLPLGLFVLLRGDSTPPEPGVAPSLGMSSSESAVPGTTGPGDNGATVSPRPGAGAPDGRISKDELMRSTIEVPPWPQDNLTGLSGPVTFRGTTLTVPPDDRFDFPRYMYFGDPVYGDVDRDGARETVVPLYCVVQGGSVQLLALDRDRTGRIVTLGTVVATTGEIRLFDTVSVTADHVVRVKVGDFQRCCGDETPQLWQTRGYSWNGQRFRQSTGPTVFPVNPWVTETGITAGDLVFGAPVDGVRRGAVSVTVAYRRGARPDHLKLTINVPPGVETDATQWPPVVNGELNVDVPAPAPGGSYTLGFSFRRPADQSGGEAGTYLRGVRADGVILSESNPFDGGASITVREAG